MKPLMIPWLAVSTALALTVATATSAMSQMIAVTSSSQPIQLTGTSGGDRKDAGCAGYISASPNHQVQVEQDSNLEFTLQATGRPALLIRSPSGQEFCVPADSYSNGKIQIPGRWGKGIYSVFVGDLDHGSHPYKLTISRS